ncbi:dihydroxyacetone kinase subunit DhaL [Streptomyces mayteni]
MAQRDAEFIRRWLEAAAEAVARDAGRLTELDSAIGDADHGSNMRRGFVAVVATLAEEPPADPGGTLRVAGRTLISKVGGAAGPLYGTLLRSAGKALGDDQVVDDERLAEALRAGVDGVVSLGGAAVGDKTMVDALLPAVTALPDYPAARQAAEEGAAATVPLRARKGRASYLGARSMGHLDPGAASSALLIGALADAAAAGAEAGDG